SWPTAPESSAITPRRFTPTADTMMMPPGPAGAPPPGDAPVPPAAPTRARAAPGRPTRPAACGPAGLRLEHRVDGVGRALRPAALDEHDASASRDVAGRGGQRRLLVADEPGAALGGGRGG